MTDLSFLYPPLLARSPWTLVDAREQLYLLLVLLTPPIPRTPAAARTFISPLHPSAPKPLPSTVRDRATVDLSVIVPAYNETARLPAMLESALVHLTMLTSRSTPISSEVVIVDDGSKDDTAGKALELAGAHAKEAGSKAIEVRVVRLPRNVGKGGAVRHGMLHARGRRLLMVDADGASRFEDVDALWAAMDTIAPLEGDGAGVVVGSRAHLVSTAAVVKVRPTLHLHVWGSGRLILAWTALAAPQRAHVRSAHYPARRWRRTRCGHAVRLQVIFSERRRHNFRAPAPHNVDLRR